MQNLGIWVITGTGGQNTGSKVHIWNRRPWFAYSICNFYGATMMIKGSLLFLLLGLGLGFAPLLSIFGRKKNCPVLGQNLTVWGINMGLKLCLSFITQKRHILVWFYVFWAIARKNPSTGPLLSIFGQKKLSRFGPKFDGLGDKYGFEIKFKFYNPKKAHPCVILRLLSYRA